VPISFGLSILQNICTDLGVMFLRDVFTVLLRSVLEIIMTMIRCWNTTKDTLECLLSYFDAAELRTGWSWLGSRLCWRWRYAFPVIIFPIIIRAVVYDETRRDVRLSAPTTQESVPTAAVAAAAAAAAVITLASRGWSCRIGGEWIDWSGRTALRMKRRRISILELQWRARKTKRPSTTPTGAVGSVL